MPLQALAIPTLTVDVKSPTSLRNGTWGFDFQINEQQAKSHFPHLDSKSLINIFYNSIVPTLTNGMDADFSPYRYVLSILPSGTRDVLQHFRRTFEGQLDLVVQEWMQQGTNEEDFFRAIIFRQTIVTQELSNSFLQYLESKFNDEDFFDTRKKPISYSPFVRFKAFNEKLDFYLKKFKVEPYDMSVPGPLNVLYDWGTRIASAIFTEFYDREEPYIHAGSTQSQLTFFLLPAIKKLDSQRFWKNSVVAVGIIELLQYLDSELLKASQTPDIEAFLNSLDDEPIAYPLFFLKFLKASVDLNLVMDCIKSGNLNPLKPYSHMFHTLSRGCLNASDSSFKINKSSCLKHFKERMIWFEIKSKNYFPEQTFMLLADQSSQLAE